MDYTELICDADKNIWSDEEAPSFQQWIWTAKTKTMRYGSEFDRSIAKGQSLLCEFQRVLC